MPDAAPQASASRADLARSLPASTPTNTVPDGWPGDNGSPLVGHTLAFVRDARMLLWERVDRYGPDFTLRMFGRPVLIVGHPDSVRQVLMDPAKQFSSRLGWHPAIGQLFARGLMLRDFEEHRVHRRIMQIAFRADAMRTYLDGMNPIIQRTLDDWGHRGEFKFYDAIKQLTLDLAAEVFVGLELGPEADAINRAFVDSVQASIAVIKKEVPFTSYRRGMVGRRLLEEFFASRIDDRRASTGSDMFSEFCRATTEDGESFSDRDVVDHMIFLLMAAHDTTTSSLTALIWALAQYPEWQETLRDEARAADQETLTWEQRERAVWAGRAFKEALRMFPPVPFISRRTIEPSSLSDFELPANFAVSVSSLITHYSNEFWKNPRQFDPDRFSAERAEDKQHSHVYYPFGGGAHTCLGMHFADSQVKAFMHQFLLRYRVHLRPGYQLDMRPIPMPRPKDGLPVRLERC